MESDKYDLDNKPRYNSVFKQKLNYGDLLNLTLSINPELKLAYELKEMYRDFNKNCTYEQAEERLNDLIAAFEEADLPCYKEFLGILKNWKQEIINSFLRPYDNRKQSNALAENINEKLRQLIDIANGYSNFERFRARALYCLNDRLFYALTTSLTSKKRKDNKRGTYNKEHKLIEEDIEVLIEDNEANQILVGSRLLGSTNGVCTFGVYITYKKKALICLFSLSFLPFDCLGHK